MLTDTNQKFKVEDKFFYKVKINDKNSFYKHKSKSKNKMIKLSKKKSAKLNFTS